ncbi:winged helix domain-containing protein [Paludibacterium denitrificans]|uniref:winged helix domain-containing protein n=1 Tax=Paludibacterium denitrificans TaxID=2675226 RepID=UPI001E4654DC|nr:winged helix domain-containing protein [Paludibacterium denitrificans]
MVEQVSQILARVQWDQHTVSDFLGHYLTEPKAHVFYDAPDDALDEEEFAAQAQQQGVVLDRKSQILFDDSNVYCNGERLDVETVDKACWHQFANWRKINGNVIEQSMMPLLYEGYLAGYWHWRQCSNIAISDVGLYGRPSRKKCVMQHCRPFGLNVA